MFKYLALFCLLLLLATGCGSDKALKDVERTWYDYDRTWKISDEGEPTGVMAKIALWPVNRIADLFDIISFQFGFGFGVHVNAHATRLLQFGAGAATVSRLGFDGRRFGLCNDVKAEFSLLPFSTEYYKRQNAFGNFLNYTDDDYYMKYMNHRDYWGIGAEATAGVANAGVEVHLKEIPDFILGLFFIDYMHDDFPREWTGNDHPFMAREDMEKIDRIVIVPSRVLDSGRVRMTRNAGLSVYYNRYGYERFFGKLGTLFGSGSDDRVKDEYSGYLCRRSFDIHRELIERVHRSLVVSAEFDVVDIDETLKYFDEHSVVKERRGQEIRRLPNYKGLAEHFGANTVIDIRIWEWGIWRDRVESAASMKVDCEYKVIRFPENEVIFNSRVLSLEKGKRGRPITEFARNEGDMLISETREACDVVHSKIHDLLLEPR